jgi:hypothetical protein
MFVITFENSAGVLDSGEADTEEGAAIEARRLINEAGELHHGDVIRVTQT